MPIPLVCSCSAVLEVDDRFAGQRIQCPDCQKPIQVPGAQGAPRRTSGFAVASLVLALVGAFTVFGTLAAVVCGGVALLHIQQRPEKLAGRPVALAGIVLGAGLTALNLLLYFSGNLLGVDGLAREARWIGKLEYPADLTVKRRDFAVRRPSAEWGVFPPGATNANEYQSSQNLMLVLPSKSAYVICMVAKVDAGQNPDAWQEAGVEAFRQLDVSRFTLAQNPNIGVHLERENKRQANKEQNGKKTRFMDVTARKTYRGQTRTYILRLAKSDDETAVGSTNVYIIAAGAPAGRMDGPNRDTELRKELQAALDSFQILE